MNQEDQTKHFARELDKLVERFMDEFSLTLASAVGVLQIKQHLLIEMMYRDEDDDSVD